ncbi:hypothetical protein DFQ50_105362 [Pseudocitrobacter faecalis]|uniref:Uncharacterized protein n=2 Tax=Pseudocitrobacter TaxID=1504576 RepID=A0ABX9FZV3_9ENTR|nr:hypothetical protein DFQ50_105362 [Pseudocitrobacter faecalis]CAH6636506.1 hypothetical protein FBBNIHIM_06710 [Pseudocitrobacter vendiensis]
MNMCKKKTQQIRNILRSLNIVNRIYKVSVCDADGILGHSDAR